MPEYSILRTGIILTFEPPPQPSPAGRGSKRKVRIMPFRSIYGDEEEIMVEGKTVRVILVYQYLFPETSSITEHGLL